MTITKNFSDKTTFAIVALALILLATCSENSKKIVFVPGELSHGYGMHEHRAGLLLIARSLKQQWPKLETIVMEKNTWPERSTLANADALVMACEGSKHVALPHLDQIDHLVERGMGVGLIHYATDPPIGPGSEAVQRWVGATYEKGFSVNPDWAAEFNNFPDHPAANGLKPFSVYDEWYFNMRFTSKRRNITSILEARPPLSALLRKDGPSSNNSTVTESVLRGDYHPVAWVYEPPDRGRGFGFTGAHHHHNYRNDDFRKAVLNGIAWIAGLDIPKSGVESKTPTWDEISLNQDYEKPLHWEQNAGLNPAGFADPMYSTSRIHLNTSRPFNIEVKIPPNRYRHIYFVFEVDSMLPGLGSPSNSEPLNGYFRLLNPRFRGENENEAPLHQEIPWHFIAPHSLKQSLDHRTENMTHILEASAPSLLHYPIPRGSTHFLASVSLHQKQQDNSQAIRNGRVHVFFASPRNDYFHVD